VPSAWTLDVRADSAMEDTKVQMITPRDVEAKVPEEDPPSSEGGEGLEQKASKVVGMLDSYAVEERQPNFFGAVILLCILPATLVYAIMLYVQLQNNPFIESNQVEWSMAFGPFPVDFECTAVTGCMFSGANSGTHEEPTHATCVTMERSERQTFFLDYAGGKTPMVSLYTLNGSASIGSIWSESNKWDADPPTYKNGMFPMPAPLFGATLNANYVTVTNKTLEGVGHKRNEWFLTYMSSDGSHEPFDKDPCEEVVKARGPMDQYLHTRIRMAPFFNKIEVTQSFSILEYIGTTSGMYGLFISGGALILAVLELDFCTRRLSKIFMAWSSDARQEIVKQGKTIMPKSASLPRST